MKRFKIKNKKGQSAIEFVLLLPVLVYVVLLAFQMFSITYTSMINQAATRFELFRTINNNRGRAEKLAIASVPGGLNPIHPGLETYSSSFRAKNNRGTVSGSQKPSRPYFAMMTEEPTGSMSFPKREIRTIGTKIIEVKTKFGICERSEGLCK